MNIKFLILSGSTLAALGCGQGFNSNRESLDTLRLTSEEKLACVGGEPGLIDLHGALVSDNKLDTRIQAKQVAGLSGNGEQVPLLSKKNKINLTSEIDATELKDFRIKKNYINFGCSLSADLKKNLKGFIEIKPEVTILKEKSIITASAAKVFICGPQDTNQVIISIEAEEILMKNADLKVKNFTGTMSMAAKRLQIFGSNSIHTEGARVASTFFSAPPILLYIDQEVIGSGTLDITSTGGSCP